MTGPALPVSVLIVDRDPHQAEAIRAALSRAGYRVCGVAHHPKQALALTRSAAPDLAVVEVDLGQGPDGVVLARRLAAIRPMGVIFVTGDRMALHGIDVGRAYVARPYRLIDLVRTLDIVRAQLGRSPSNVAGITGLQRPARDSAAA